MTRSHLAATTCTCTWQEATVDTVDTLATCSARITKSRKLHLLTAPCCHPGRKSHATVESHAKAQLLVLTTHTTWLLWLACQVSCWGRAAPKATQHAAVAKLVVQHTPMCHVNAMNATVRCYNSTGACRVFSHAHAVTRHSQTKPTPGRPP